uniref:rhodanese-like domain-containing protein n=1 Tax=Prevotella sp. TaxID=59823 RepID=UPI0025D1B41A|nr:rhodanese-like domain-containing protein [Prevotella sp.]
MKKILLSLLTAISFGTTGCSAQSDSIDTLAPQAFIKQAKADTTSIILDVRTPGEYKEEHLAGAQQLDFLNTSVFDAGIKLLDKSHTYYVYCRSGKRSHNACIKMKKQGFKVFDMEGGILNWKKLGMPTTKE